MYDIVVQLYINYKCTLLGKLRESINYCNTDAIDASICKMKHTRSQEYSIVKSFPKAQHLPRGSICAETSGQTTFRTGRPIHIHRNGKTPD